MKPLPQSMKKLWGPSLEPSLTHLTANLNELHFDGPVTYALGYTVPYYYDPCPSVRISLALSRKYVEEGMACVDVNLVVYSRTVYEKTLQTDPWYSPNAKSEHWIKGYVGCVAMTLSHLDWCLLPSDNNPIWKMTLDTFTENNVQDMFKKIRLHFFSRVQNLKSDEDLKLFLANWMNYKKPTWVRSDGPRSINFERIMEALDRQF